jgi:hypothetical protein
MISKSIENEKQLALAIDSGGSVADGSISYAANEIVLSKEGFKLFPQPVLGDNLDPLNWSFVQKHTILAIVMSM